MIALHIGTSRVTNIEKLVATTDEHGDEQLTFNYTAPPQRLPGLREHVSLFDPKYGYTWHGYIAQVKPSWNGCGSVLCRGIWHTADDVPWYEEKKYLAGTPLATLLVEALAKCARIQGTTANLATEFQTQLVEDSPNFGLQSPQDVFNYAQQLSDYLTTPLVWQVRQNPTSVFNPQPILDLKFQDIAPRYRVRLTLNDEFGPVYDADIIYNVGAVRWGNQQYQLATNTAYSAPQIPNNPPPSLPVVDRSIIPDVRIKRIDAASTINDLTEIQQLARFLVVRNNILRAMSSQLVIDCNTLISSVYPAIISDNLPHYLVRSNFAIRILNIPINWKPYINDVFYIASTSYDFDTGKLSLSVGDPVLRDALRLQGNYDVSREYISVRSGVINLVRRDADVLSQYGPEYTGQSLVPNPDDAQINNSPSAGIPQFISSTDSTTRTPKLDDPNNAIYQPHGQSVDPSIIPDYGTQANFGREADSVGIKGFIQLVPCKVLNWTISFLPPANSDVIPTDTITIEFYDSYPFAPGSPFATKAVSPAAQTQSGVFTTLEQKVFPQGGKLGIRVSIAATTTGAGFQIAVGSRKLYPDLGINS